MPSSGSRGGQAIIEAAQACGLARLPRREAATAGRDELGVGELIAAAAARGARRIVLGLGGVASTDGGAGMVQALGGRLLDQAGRELPPGGAALAALHRLDLAGLPSLAGIEVLVAADVDNPLLGRHGAAAVYGPQKGASPDEVAILEAGLARWAGCSERALAGLVPRQAAQPGPRPSRRVSRPRDEPGAGAAGGLGFAALAFLGARTRPGIELMLDLISFAGRAAGARLVITGEGSLDAQTLRGKAPAGVARAAASAGAGPVVAVAGPVHAQRRTASPGRHRGRLYPRRRRARSGPPPGQRRAAAGGGGAQAGGGLAAGRRPGRGAGAGHAL